MTDEIFRPLLDSELVKICKFYETQEQLILQDLEGLEKSIQSKEEEFLHDPEQHYMDFDNHNDDDDDDDDDDRESPVRERSQRISRSIPRRGRGARTFTKLICSNSPLTFCFLIAAIQTSLSHDSRRRLSVSSSEDNYDLEASLVSLGQIPENDALQTSVGDLRASSVSPTRSRARAALSNIFSLVKPDSSVSSSLLGKDTIWNAKNNYAFDTRALFKRRITTLYNSATSLRAYVELNYSGFRKILKKYGFLFFLLSFFSFSPFYFTDDQHNRYDKITYSEVRNLLIF